MSEELTLNKIDGSVVRTRGTNQSGMRANNERLILSLIREHKSLAKAELTKMTALSAQTVSVIMRELESEGLLLRGEPLRGRVGQPSVPMSLNPEGAFFFGLKVGRRSAQLVLIDLMGTVLAMESRSYKYPLPDEIQQFALAGIESVQDVLGPEKRSRISGLGIALPYQLWDWADSVGANETDRNAWEHADIRASLAKMTEFPIFLQNDATTACGAELAFGRGHGFPDFLYFYIGSFIGGGVVLNNSLFSGRTGNAGALGSMPVSCRDGSVKQLIDIASLTSLEKKLHANGKSANMIWNSLESWGSLDDDVLDWIDESGRAIAQAAMSSISVIDFQAIVVDGWLPREIVNRLVDVVSEYMRSFNSAGLTLPVIYSGTVGAHARAIGGASLPLSERFLLGQPDEAPI